MSGFQLPNNPREVWLAGKGPSLDRYDWSRANEYRIGINQAAYIVPECWAALAYDLDILLDYQRFLDPAMLVIHRECEIMPPFQRAIIMTQHDVCLAGGSAALAFQLFEYCDIKRVHCVGFDSIDGDGHIAASILGITPFLHADSYCQINQNLLQRIHDSKIEVVWEHR